MAQKSLIEPGGAAAASYFCHLPFPAPGAVA